jgi:hypothetical protein
MAMNESGRGASSEVPAEIRGWNWGAFLLSWIWGIGNATPLALLTLVPCVGIVMPFVLGAKGTEWAWQNRRWHGTSDFQRTQRSWAVAGIVTWVAGAVAITLLLLGARALLGTSDVYQLAEARLRHNPEIAHVFGAPLETGMATGSVKTTGPTGEAKLAFDLQGPKAHGTVYVNATKDKGEWIIDELEVEVDGREERIRLMP